MLLHTVAPLSKRLPFSKGGARSARAVREAARSKSVEAPKGWRGEGRAAFVRPFSLREKGGFWAGLLHTVVPLTKRLPLIRRGAHEARALWAKQREVSPMSKGEPQANL